MYPMIFVFLPFIVVMIMFVAFASRRVNCPDCGERLPVLVSPFRKTRRMWLAGGALCTRCGCETNLAGQKITADMPPAPFPSRHYVLLAASLVLGIGLAAGLTRVRSPIAPPMAAAPRQAPIVPPSPHP